MTCPIYKKQAKLIRIYSRHHKHVLECLTGEKISLETAKLDFVDRYRAILRQLVCFTCENYCGHEPKSELWTSKDKHLSKYDTDHRTFFPYKQLLMDCKHLNDYLDTFELIKEIHLPQHAEFHDLSGEEAEKNFIESFGQVTKQMYCMMCKDQKECGYNPVEDLKESLEKTIKIPKKLERILEKDL